MRGPKPLGWLGSLQKSAAATLRPLRHLSPRAALGAGLLITLVLVPFFLWARWGGPIVESPRYLVTAESIEIPQQPEWIHGDVRAEVIRDGSLGGLSILDKDAAVRVARAFELHNWVAEVQWATKHAGPKIHVLLRYRRPALMVRATEGGFWPVDTEGVLLPPDDFSPGQTREYVRLVAEGAEPSGPVGTPFGDPRIKQGTALADLLANHWKSMKIKQLVARWDAPPNGHPPQLPQFEIETASASRVIWGSAPGHERPNEARADVKLARLVELAQRYGSLAGMDDRSAVDLRPFGGVSVIGQDQDLRPVDHRALDH